MSSSAPLIFSRLPPVWPANVRALASRKPTLLADGQTIPPLEARLAGFRAPAEHLARYRAVCAFPADGRLPITYPHVLAAPLHLALLTGPHFPLRPIGLVHLRNRIEALRPVGEAERLDLACRFGGHRETDRGQEFDLVTEAGAGGEVAWREVSTLLARRPGVRTPRPTAEERHPPPPGDRPDRRWPLAPGLGRAYAAASGDYNLIHLSAVTARLFGFRRAIAHGMWSLGRIAAELAPALAPAAQVLELSFKLPVFLPGTVTLRSWAREGGLDFLLLDADGLRPHAAGRIAPLA
jgi:acyl dehydratase